jgi:trans-aconitate 2-methyltransferase
MRGAAFVPSVISMDTVRSHRWDPQRYLSYRDERARPFVELLARVPEIEPATVTDLGCGPGNLTSLLADRWPAAEVVGIDSSVEMIASATDPRIEFRVGDLREWAANGPPGSTGQVEVIVSNAALQWVPDHLGLLQSLVERVEPGGWLAFQVPGNFAEPMHTIRDELAAEPPYDVHTRGLAEPYSYDPAAYLAALTRLGCSVDAWETTYLHQLHGEDPVFSWISGTSARPVLQALPTKLRLVFEDGLKQRLREAYPDDGEGVVLPFRRIFVVAQARA